MPKTNLIPSKEWQLVIGWEHDRYDINERVPFWTRLTTQNQKGTLLLCVFTRKSNNRKIWCPPMLEYKKHREEFFYYV